MKAGKCSAWHGVDAEENHYQEDRHNDEQSGESNQPRAVTPLNRPLHDSLHLDFLHTNSSMTIMLARAHACMIRNSQIASGPSVF